jgi:D-arginine dehydrogenase
MAAGDTHRFDVAIIGAGIAGASAAYQLAATHRAVLIEREDQPGYHTTGRSAALYSETYGNAAIRALTTASRALLESPPAEFSAQGFLSPRGVVYVAPRDLRDAVDALLKEVARPKQLYEIDRDTALKHVPVIDPDNLDRALYEPEAMDIDVHALHQAFLRGFRARGGTLVTDAEVSAIAHSGGSWRATTRQGVYAAPALVNAAGAWCDEIGRMAGAAPIGLVPKRRTAFMFDPPAALDTTHWPLLIDVAEQFYVKPDAGRLLGSPADETPSPPCDAQPEELDIAIAIDRIQSATTMRIDRIGRKWAGLRSFVADKTPVVGEARRAPGFFWLAGQGGYGIQTCGAMGRFAAAIVRGAALDADLIDLGLTPETLAPGRLGA